MESPEPIDAISAIRDGNTELIKTWIAEYLRADKDSKEQKKREILGLETSWGGNMSGLIWALDIPDQNSAREISKILLDTFPELVNIVDSVKSSPLHYASLNGDSYMIQLLFSKGIATPSRLV